MRIGRNSHTATLLADGRVLIAGGRNEKQEALDGVEIYDPQTETFANTGSLNVARFNHHATLLSNQKVLVTGGGSPPELYDPDTGTWSIMGPGGAQMGEDSATLLSNGNVLVIGGMDNSQKGICRIYDTLSESWTLTGPLGAPRHLHTATLMDDGRVLVCGGEDYATGNVVGTTEIYTPATGVWTPTGSLATARRRHTAALMTDGNILICGGNSAEVLASAEIFTPATGEWSPTSPLSTPRSLHTANRLDDGKILVIGGVPSASSVLATAETFDPATRLWTAADSLGTSRCLHATTRLANGCLLISSGWGAYDQAGPGTFDLGISSAEEFGPPTPKISIAVEGGRIASGSTGDFGNVSIGKTSIRQFTIKNIGSADLTNLSLESSGTNVDRFTITPPGIPTTLEPGGSVSIFISFTPVAEGAASSILTIHSNDSYEENFSINLLGNGTPRLVPEITIKNASGQSLLDGTTRVSFGRVALGQSKAKIFTIHNVGTAELKNLAIRITGKHKSEFLIEQPAKSVLSPGASVKFTVRFKPTATVSRIVNLHVASNDADENPFDVNLTGTGKK